MLIGERIRKLRKALDLTQAEFGEKIGSTQNAIGNYETGHRNPSSSVINNTCKTFNVSEAWLRTGDGEMYLPKPSTALDLLAIEYSLTDYDRILIEKLLSLKPDTRRALIEYLKDVAMAITTDSAATVSTATGVPAVSGDSEDLDLEAEVEAYRRRRIEEKKQETQTSAVKESGAG